MYAVRTLEIVVSFGRAETRQRTYTLWVLTGIELSVEACRWRQCCCFGFHSFALFFRQILISRVIIIVSFYYILVGQLVAIEIDVRLCVVVPSRRKVMREREKRKFQKTFSNHYHIAMELAYFFIRHVKFYFDAQGSEQFFIHSFIHSNILVNALRARSSVWFFWAKFQSNQLAFAVTFHSFGSETLNLCAHLAETLTSNFKLMTNLCLF